jgi:hypothetical protein
MIVNEFVYVHVHDYVHVHGSELAGMAEYEGSHRQRLWFHEATMRTPTCEVAPVLGYSR